MSKNKSIFLVEENTFRPLLDYIKSNSPIDWYILFAFKHTDLLPNLTMLRELKREMFALKREEFLKNVVILTDFEYLANDMGVRGVVIIDKIDNDTIQGFIRDFDMRSNMYYKIEEYLSDYGYRNKCQVDIYNNRGPWLMSINDKGILFINENTYDIIMNNYHKVRNLSPDITVISFNDDEYDELCAKILKLIGSDALITFGITSKKTIPYNKRLDAMVYSKSPFKEDYMRKFIIAMLSEKNTKDNFITFRDFLGVPEKDFSPDIWWDEEAEVKPQKFLKLKLLVFDKDKAASIKIGYTDMSLTVIKKKKGAYNGNKKIEVITIDILKK